MTGTAEPRKPRVFEPGDPSLVPEPEPAVDAGIDAAPPVAPDAQLARPTLADLGQQGLRWGAVLAASLAGAAALGAAAWFARLVSAALAREDWVGTATLVLLLSAALSAAMLLLREIIGFTRLARLGRLKRDIAAAITERDSKRERQAAQRLAALFARRPELAWSVRRFREHARDVHDAGELLVLADREMVVPLDLEARRLVTRSARRVATVTAMSPMVLIAVGYVLIENLRLLRMLATLYGGRPGVIGVLTLARMVFTHMIATGGIAMTDDLLGQFLGQDLLRRLSRRLGEGAFNGALTARLGVAALEVIRPLPFLASKAPRVRDILAEALRALTPRQ
jgi:putative membrane protein